MKNKYKPYQGRSSKQVEDSSKLALVGFVVCSVILVLLIFNSILEK